MDGKFEMVSNTLVQDRETHQEQSKEKEKRVGFELDRSLEYLAIDINTELKNGIYLILKCIIMELSKKEKEAGIIPNPDADTYMKDKVSKKFQELEASHLSLWDMFWL
ncbi:pleiotropic drug resistance protein 3 [Senna tora]|uniref:Pleiotropic drug resistance protein 3 n=1 Tax=Senna tora TaxID=362788 RepID=A0A834TGI8_9FABA|nr:pleiotropic drug resistance protein 3 [Senna tora]